MGNERYPRGFRERVKVQHEVWENTTSAQGGGAGGVTNFTDLADVPSSYTGEGGNLVAVNFGETDLEFVVPVSTFIQLTDVPSSYTGEGGKLVAVSGAENALEFVSGLPNANSITTVDLVDEFFGGGTGTTQVGELGWALSGGTVARISGEVDHPGIYRRSVTGTTASTFFNGTGFVTTFLDNFTYACFVIRTDAADITNTRIFVGLAGTTTPFVNNSSPDESIAFRYDAATNANWRLISRTGAGTEEDTDTGVAVAANTWYKMEIVYDGSSSVEFFLNDVSEGTHTTLPGGTSGLNPNILLISTSGAKTLDIDYFRMNLTVSR